MYLLRRAMYSVKQASEARKKNATQCFQYAQILKVLGCTMSNEDPRLFFGGSGKDEIWILIYVRDVLMAGRSRDNIMAFLKDSGQHVEMRIDVAPTTFLGIELNCSITLLTLQTLSMHNRTMTKALEEKFGLQNEKPIHHPIQAFALLQCRDTSEGDLNVPYTETGGISDAPFRNGSPGNFICSRVSGTVNEWLPERTLEGSDGSSTVLVVVLVRYLRATINHQIIYRREDAQNLVGYSDADFAEYRTSRKSTSGFFFMLGAGPVAWRSKKQTVVPQSTPWSEYEALSLTVREAIWLRTLHTNLREEMPNKAKLLRNYPGMIELSLDKCYNDLSRHIDVKYHLFLHSTVQRGLVNVEYRDTRKTIADGLSKGLDRVVLNGVQQWRR